MPKKKRGSDLRRKGLSLSAYLSAVFGMSHFVGVFKHSEFVKMAKMWQILPGSEKLQDSVVCEDPIGWEDVTGTTMVIVLRTNKSDGTPFYQCFHAMNLIKWLGSNRTNPINREPITEADYQRMLGGVSPAGGKPKRGTRVARKTVPVPRSPSPVRVRSRSRSRSPASSSR